MRCMNICPERAIQASWLGAVAQLCVLLVVFETIVAAVAAIGGPTTRLAASVVACVALLALTGPTYRIAWFLGRPRAAAWLLGHTTPTRLFRRYREPETDLRDV